MPAIGYPYNLISGLSSFWNQFFADADQLSALYKGSAMLIGQAYLDLMSATLGVSLKDAVVLDREYYRLLTIREDEIRFVEGQTSGDDRWAFTLPVPVVSFASLDNQVVEPSASLEEQRDYEITNGVVLFHVDPTNPTNTGVPLNGYARRSTDIAVGGSFTDSTVTAWTTTNVNKGDTLRTLDVGTDGTQRARGNYEIAVVRDPALFVSATLALTAPMSSVPYVIVRVPYDAIVLGESITITGAGSVVSLAHTRVDQGSVRVYAKAPSGADVREGTDYVVNYEAGTVTAVTAWMNLPGPFGVDYTWQEEVVPFSTTGQIVSTSTTTRVVQMAVWAPDALVDRMTLANNFGSFIGRMEPSSEAYRSFLEGIFQLYIMGPVIERIESALNVVLNLPVIVTDGETYLSTDTSDPIVDRVFTLRPGAVQPAMYAFPKGTPLRTDLIAGLAFQAFEPLTIAVIVTDYVQTPSWWYGEVIPQALFSPATDQVPSIFRRRASPYYVANVIDATDNPEIGDPGLYIGCDESGVVLDPLPSTIYRHCMAFVVMDEYLKYHTFSVKFNAAALSASTGTAFAQSLADLNNLVLVSKPSHTFAFVTPTTFFADDIEIDEDSIDFTRLVGSRVHGPDQILFTDDPPLIGGTVWNIGDYFKYEQFTPSTTFTTPSVPVTLSNAPAGPRHGYLVRVHVGGNVGGVALVENVDYTVDYANRTVTRLTSWASSTVTVDFTQLNIGNLSDAAIGAGDMPLMIDGVDPALITGAFDAGAEEWDGSSSPLTAPRDIGMVERALIVYPH